MTLNKYVAIWNLVNKPFTPEEIDFGESHFVKYTRRDSGGRFYLIGVIYHMTAFYSTVTF